MTDDRSLERAARSWLEIGPTEAPDRAVEAALLRIQTTPQERDLRIPWRFPTMTTPARVATAAVIGVLVVGGALFILGRPGQSDIGGPGPTATSTPSTSPTPVPVGQREPVARPDRSRSARAGSTDGAAVRTASREWRLPRPASAGMHRYRPGRHDSLHVHRSRRMGLERFGSRDQANRPQVSWRPAGWVSSSTVAAGCTAIPASRSDPGPAGHPGRTDRRRLRQRACRPSSHRTPRLPRASRSVDTVGKYVDLQLPSDIPISEKFRAEIPKHPAPSATTPGRPRCPRMGPSHRWHLWILMSKASASWCKPRTSRVPQPQTVAELQAIVDSIQIRTLTRL